MLPIVGGYERDRAIVGESADHQQLIALAEAVPEEIVSQWPRDGASQHDHYIYGTPKRTDLRDKPE